MTVFVVATVSSFVDSQRISAFHYEMFHGVSHRPGLKHAHIDYALGDIYDVAMQITRSGPIVPDIFSPSTNLVVSAAVKHKLRSWKNIDFCEIAFRKLVWFEWQIGDFSWYDDPTRTQPPEMFHELPDSPELHRSIGSYYEMILPRLAKLRDRYQPSRQLRVDLGSGCAITSVELDLSPELVLDYPALKALGTIVFRADLFDVVSEHLDRDFYRVVEAAV